MYLFDNDGYVKVNYLVIVPFVLIVYRLLSNLCEIGLVTEEFEEFGTELIE